MMFYIPCSLYCTVVGSNYPWCLDRPQFFCCMKCNSVFSWNQTQKRHPTKQILRLVLCMCVLCPVWQILHMTSKSNYSTNFLARPDFHTIFEFVSLSDFVHPFRKWSKNWFPKSDFLRFFPKKKFPNFFFSNIFFLPKKSMAKKFQKKIIFFFQ